MFHILEQTIIMAKRFKKDPESLEKNRGDEFLIRIPDTETKIINWKDSVIRVPPQEPQEIHFKINAGDIEKLQNLPLSDLTFEADLIMLPSSVEEKGIKPYFAYLLMVVDKRSEMILGNEIMKLEPMTCELGINLQLTDRLNVLEFAKKDMLKYMGKM